MPGKERDYDGFGETEISDDGSDDAIVDDFTSIGKTQSFAVEPKVGFCGGDGGQDGPAH